MAEWQRPRTPEYLHRDSANFAGPQVGQGAKQVSKRKKGFLGGSIAPSTSLRINGTHSI